MSRFCSIAVDAMGGDFGPRVTVAASIAALEKHPHLTISLVGHTSSISPFLTPLNSDIANRIEVVHVDGVIGMEEKPSSVLRNRGETSMSKALELVAEGQVSACVSAGNTGALMVLGRKILKMLPGIDRPALISPIPTFKSHSYMLDLGANVDTSAHNLLQFAVMGSVLAEAVDGLNSPRIGLLNIGQEEIKGTESVKEAAGLLSQSGLNYIGFIEGDDVFGGAVDVIVCDGFVGNIALKSSEGLARLIYKRVKQEFSRSIWGRMVGVLARPLLMRIATQLDPTRRNGASLLGLNGSVVKSHGSATRACFGFAIEQAMAEAEKDVPALIKRQLAEKLVNR